MIHQILIEFMLTPQNPNSMTTFNVALKVTNVGTDSFPGGTFTHFMIQTANTAQSASPSTLPKVPPLSPNESRALEPNTFLTIEAGVARLTLELKANDNTQVDLYQNPEFNMGKRYFNLFKIRDSETLEIISLLKKVVELLEGKNKK